MQNSIERNTKMIQQSRAAQGLDAEIRFHFITDQTTSVTFKALGLSVGHIVIEMLSFPHSRSKDTLISKTKFTILAGRDYIEVATGDVIAMNENEFWHAGVYDCKRYNLQINKRCSVWQKIKRAITNNRVK